MKAYLLGFLCGAQIALAACVTSSSPPLPEHPAWASWDQENLKRDDRGCPTAIFIAPNGTLKECL